MTDMQNEMNNHTVGSDGIFLRAADRARFDYLMRAIREESASMALSSDNDGVLDHYGRLVLSKLRKTDGLQIEVFLPQNTEQLLERYNQILAGLSIEDARKASASPAPRRVLLAHDAKALSTRDLQLLARLVQDFPGANVSLVLLVDKAGIKLHERTLEGFGQRLLRWPVDAPTRSEGDALLKVARAMGFEVEAKKVLAATGYAEIKIAPKKDKPKAEPDAAQVRFEQQLAAARKERDDLDEADRAAQEKSRMQESLGRTEPSLDGPAPEASLFSQGQQAGRGRSLAGTVLRWAVALAMLLAVSIGVIVALFPQRMSPLLANSPILKDNLPPWAMEMVVSVVGKPPAAALEDSRADAAKATVPAGGADLPKDDVASVPEAAAAGPANPAGTALANAAAPAVANPAAAAAPSTTAPAAPADGKLQPPKAEAGKTDPARTESAKAEARADAKPDAKAEAKTDTKAEAKADVKLDVKPDVKPDAKAMSVRAATANDALAPRSESGIDAAVRAAKAGSFYVQHVSLGSMAEAQEWRAQYGALSGAKIVAVNTQDKGIKFAVISGPFADRKQAEAFATKPGVPADPWLRPVKSLQGALLGSR